MSRTKKKPAPRRTVTELKTQADKLWAYLKNKGPQRSEHLTAVFKTTAEKMAPVIRVLSRAKRLKVAGNTRATVYAAIGKAS